MTLLLWRNLKNLSQLHCVVLKKEKEKEKKQWILHLEADCSLLFFYIWCIIIDLKYLLSGISEERSVFWGDAKNIPTQLLPSTFLMSVYSHFYSLKFPTVIVFLLFNTKKVSWSSFILWSQQVENHGMNVESQRTNQIWILDYHLVSQRSHCPPFEVLTVIQYTVFEYASECSFKDASHWEQYRTS